MAAYKTFTHQGELTPDQIRDQVGYVPIARSPYGPIAQEVNIGRGDVAAGNMLASDVNTVIADLVDEFNETDTVKIPTLENSEDAPVYGQGSLDGADAEAIEFSQTEVNVGLWGKRFPVPRDIITKIRSKKVGDLMRLTRKNVVRWAMRVRTEQITRSWYEGRPLHISRASSDYIPTALGTGTPLGKGRNHCPNIHVAGQGLVSHSTTHTVFDSSINDYLVLLQGDGSAAALPNPDALDAVLNDMNYKDFEPALEEYGAGMFIGYATPEVFQLLKANDKIKQIEQSAFRGAMMKDPILTPGDLIYRNIVIKQHKDIAWEIHHSCTDPSGAAAGGWYVRYGPMNSDENQELSLFGRQSTDSADRDIHALLILGKRGMHIARAGRANVFEKMSQDERTGYVYCEMATGCERNDIYRGTSIASPESIINRSVYVVAFRVA